MGSFARGIDGGDEECVHLAQDPGEIVQQVAGPGEPVRLEGDHQPPARPRFARRGEGRFDFARVVAVVVDEPDPVLTDPDRVPDLEAPSDPLERGERVANELVVHSERPRDGDRGERVQHVVATRQVERHIEPRPEVAGRDPEASPGLDRGHVHRPQVRLLVEAVRHDRSRHLRQHRAHPRIVRAQDGQAIERQMAEKLDECGVQARLVLLPPRLHVVVVDVGHDRHLRPQTKKDSSLSSASATM